MFSYLANDIEEDEEDDKYEIFSWVLGEHWMSQFPMFLVRRDQLWQRMGFRAIVSRKTCEEVTHLASSDVYVLESLKRTWRVTMSCLHNWLPLWLNGDSPGVTS